MQKQEQLEGMDRLSEGNLLIIINTISKLGEKGNTELLEEARKALARKLS
jgi:hypothetical protein